MAGKDAEYGVLAVAIIIRSKLQRSMRNMFLATFKKNITTRIFTDKEKAIEWAKKFRVKN